MNIKELVKPIAKIIAEDEVNQELVLHPEMATLRNKKIERKTEQEIERLAESVKTFSEDMEKASLAIEKYLTENRLEEEEIIFQELDRAIEVYLKLKEKDLDSTLDWKTRLKISDQVVNALYKIGRFYQEKGEHSQAKAIFRFLLVLDMEMYEVWIALGYSFLNLNEYQEALYIFESALTLDSKRFEAHYFLALGYFLEKMMSKAKEILEEGLRQIESEEDKDCHQKSQLLTLLEKINNELGVKMYD